METLQKEIQKEIDLLKIDVKLAGDFFIIKTIDSHIFRLEGLKKKIREINIEFNEIVKEIY
jgi:hypothetical protein